MSQNQSKSASKILKRSLSYFGDRCVFLLALFLAVWSILLWVLFNKQKETITAEMIQHRQEDISSTSARMSMVWYQSLFISHQLNEHFGEELRKGLRTGDYGMLGSAVKQKISMADSFCRFRLIDAAGHIEMDVQTDFEDDGHVSRISDEVPISFETVRNLEPGGVFISKLHAGKQEKKTGAYSVALANVQLPLFDEQRAFQGALVLTFEFYSSESNSHKGHEMILIQDGELLRNRATEEFDASSFKARFKEIWSDLQKGEHIIQDFPQKGGYSVAGIFSGDVFMSGFWDNYFTEIASELELYVVSPVYPEDLWNAAGVFLIRLLGIWFGIVIVASAIFVLIRWKVDSEKRIKDALSDEQEFLSSLLDAIPFPILSTDMSGEHINSNLALKEGWCSGKLHKSQVCDQCSGNELGLCQKILKELRTLRHQDREGGTIELEHFRSGQLRQYLLHTGRYKNHAGNDAGMIGVIVDISHFKQHETHLAEAKAEADRANNAKSAFLATMSHEIRTPLNGIIGMSSLMADTQMDETQIEYIETVKASGETLLNLINDILDFSKIEADRIELEHIPMNIESIVCDVLDMLSKQAHLEDVDLVYRVDSDLRTELLGDPVRLKQVMTNLVSNAVKFTEKGSIIVSIEQDVQDKNRIRLSVKDTGIGIDPNRIQSLFDPFVQEDSSTTRRFGGTGLGLAICKRLVASMGGELTLTSEVGKGSTFSFSLPVGAVVHDESPDNSQSRILSFLSVLAIDDNSQSLSILAEMLEEWRMEVHGFTDPVKALKWLTDGNHCDVIIADHLMPEMDGETFCMKATNYLKSREMLTPRLLMCGLEHQPDLNHVTKAVHKPIHRERVRDILVNVLTRQPQGIPKMVSVKKQPQVKFSETYPMRLLIAEDNKVNQRVIKLILKKLGFEGEFVENGMQAWKRYEEALKTDPFDIVLMDIQMPIMDGITAGRRIREIEIEQSYESECCIIALSANVLDETRVEAMEAGFNDYLCKPVKVETLKESLEKAWAYIHNFSPEKRETARGAFFTATL